MEYPVAKIDGENIPWIKPRPQDDRREFVRYRLRPEDVDNYPGAVLENLADKFYSDVKLWHLIYEVNPPISPEDYQAGMEIKLPVTSSFRESPVVTSTRKIQ